MTRNSNGKQWALHGTYNRHAMSEGLSSSSERSNYTAKSRNTNIDPGKMDLFPSLPSLVLLSKVKNCLLNVWLKESFSFQVANFYFLSLFSSAKFAKSSFSG